MADAIFEDPLLARLYDPLDPDRSDLDAYRALVDELGAHRVLDLGCGTGTFATMLAADGLDVVGVDPATASLDVARGKPHASRVRWLDGDAGVLTEVDPVDLVVMTANVFQVFLDRDAALRTLVAVREVLRPSGRLVFETRDPRRRAWEAWTPEQSRTRTEVPGLGEVEAWVEVTAVEPPLVTFRWSHLVPGTGLVTSDSTLRFWTLDEVRGLVADAGLDVDEVRDAPDRPGLEHVVVCRRTR
ncbi:methyltransferase domain-containing protein [Cellulomonas sp. DKR-3]|uniref:Methyltransferase domain-containing protein n=1 Tax=Cellulomonas fulva TaxID=2835530 RepID=A0ABS5TXC8_9CELL|nr:class I SAM-dependent methyltransferase [Cellulomonas fulva]MBT0993747.1 methyltransferase domain-containing protein [Cellulomonas fulva]